METVSLSTASRDLANMSEPEKMETASQSTTGFNTHSLYKSLLCRYAQLSKIQLPVYQTYKEGVEHKPKFRSSVWYDGMNYTSPNTFSQRKAAENDVSRVAFSAVMQKIKDEAARLIREDLVFCKSILIEYASRMKLEKPSYQTIQPDVTLPVFISSLDFNGVNYTGDAGRNKKVAEQLAARAAVLSILDSESGSAMSETIKSKFQRYAAMNKLKESCNVHNGTKPVEPQTGDDNGIILSKENEVEVAAGAINMLTSSSLSGSRSGNPTSVPSTHLPLHVLQPHNLEASSAAIAPPIISVPPGLEQTPFAGTNMPTPSPISKPCLKQSIPETHVPFHAYQQPNLEASKGSVTPITSVPLVLEQTPSVSSQYGKKRKRKNKKDAQKKMRVDAQLAMAVVHFE